MTTGGERIDPNELSGEVPVDYRPMYYMPGVNDEGNWRFQPFGERALVVSDNGLPLRDMLQQANGYNTDDQIVESLAYGGTDPDIARRVMDDLSRLRVLVDSREIGIHAHKTTDNPQLFFRPLSLADVLKITSSDPFKPREGEAYFASEAATVVGELSLNRESCRSFAKTPVEIEKIATCLRNAYSEEIHPIPSAGGLYPLRLFVIQKAASAELPRGVYQYDHKGNNLVDIESDIDELELSFIFGEENLLHNAPTIVVLAADLYRHNAKYANRGYRYTLLEAGHCAQNIHLTAQELGLSTLEYGGYLDDALAKTFNMQNGERPLVTVAIGYKSSEEFSGVSFEADQLTGGDSPVEWVTTDFMSAVAKIIRFYKSTAKFKKPNSGYGDHENLLASGTALSPRMSAIKAVAEAYERFAGGQVRYDLFESANNIHNVEWLSPDIVRPRSEAQHSRSGFTEQFDPDKPIQWILGTRNDGTQVYVPIELVFYPIDIEQIGRLLTAETDSSGMAAHTDYQEASRRALLELIERDALMRTWFYREAPDRVDINSLPLHYQRRAEFWQQLGRKMEVLDFSHHDIAIAGVAIHSIDGRYPYLVNGAAASTVSFEEALKKAFQEAELGEAEYITSNFKADRVRPENVFSPADHARFYAFEDYRSEIEWLWSGQVKTESTKISASNDVLQVYNPVNVRLTTEADPFQIVRSIAPQLIPISFGYANEVFLHPSVDRSRFKPSFVPHFFA